MLPSSRKTEVCWLPTSMLPSSVATGLWLTRSATPTGSRCIQAPVQQPPAQLARAWHAPGGQAWVIGRSQGDARPADGGCPPHLLTSMRGRPASVAM